MLELISNIIVKGGAFAEDTSLPVLCKRKHPTPILAV